MLGQLSFDFDPATASWMEAETWTYETGLPERSGIAAYVHLIRGPHDGQRESREARQERLGVEGAARQWVTLTRGDVQAWKVAIERLLGDGEPRTFNRIVLELTDGSMTADTAFGKDPDSALWALVEAGVIWWTPEAPIHFLHREFVTRCSCGDCAMEAA